MYKYTGNLPLWRSIVPSTLKCTTFIFLLWRVLYSLTTSTAVDTYRMAGNIGGEFNLADWRMKGKAAKFNSANTDFADLVPRVEYGAGNERRPCSSHNNFPCDRSQYSAAEVVFAVFAEESPIHYRKGSRRVRRWRNASPERCREVRRGTAGSRRSKYNGYTVEERAQIGKYVVSVHVRL